MMKLIYFFLMIIFLVSPVFGDEEDKKDEEIGKLRENTILYGIESQVSDLITQLKDEKNDRYNEQLKELFHKTDNTTLLIGIVDLFDTLEDHDLITDVHLQLMDYEDLSPKLVLTMLHYLSDNQTPEITATLYEMADAANIETASLSIQSIGNSGLEEYGPKLMELTEKEEFRDELEPAVIFALGKLKYEKAVTYLADIAEDEDQGNSLRWRACEALGRIGGDQAFKTIKNLLNANDSYLRAYAVGALSRFEKEDIYDILIDALRDDFWRVRIRALEALGELKDQKSLDVMRYKVYNDPDVRNVRLAAVRAIGAVDTNKGYDILREVYADATAPLLLRSESVKILVEHSLNASIKSIEQLMEEDWNKDNSQILDYTCKQLSLTKSNSLVSLYEKMLSHPKSINLLIYGLRGIRLNKYGSLKEKVEILTDKKYARSVRQLAESVLDEL